MRRFLYIWGLVGLIFMMSARPATAQLTTVGESFWVGFMENFTESTNGNAVLIITANEPAKGTIDLSNFAANWTVDFDLQPGENYTMRISTYQDDLMHRTSGIIEKKESW